MKQRSSQLQPLFENKQQRINNFLLSILPNTIKTPERLHQAMHYVVLSGGKRIRPLLVYATGEALGADLKLLDIASAAIELIHTYSLVHDDLPAMDDDDLRRGVPTCHRAFDEGTAILVGDALQTLAFEILSAPNVPASSSIQLAMVRCLSMAAGSLGMAGGQALDIEAIGRQLKRHELEQVHRLKTGTLICAAVQLGILSSDVSESPVTEALLFFANQIGLCFQIQDDILNFEGSTQAMGKTAGSDQARRKATFTTIEGLENAKISLDYFYDSAIQALEPLGNSATTLKALGQYIIARNN